jgi:putative endonuclease
MWFSRKQVAGSAAGDVKAVAQAVPGQVTTKSRGDAAEAAALAYLAKAGLKLIETNYRTPGRGGGEIDLVLWDRDGTLVFVEVKAGRAGAVIGPERPAHAVGHRKQRKLRRLAREWIAERRGPSGVAGYRFDVVGVSFGPHGLADVDHIRAAF